jgi:hypothetical protein
MKTIIHLDRVKNGAYHLVGIASEKSVELGLDKDSILEEMTRSNVENLVEVFQKYFGNYFLLKSKKWLD